MQFGYSLPVEEWINHSSKPVPHPILETPDTPRSLKCFVRKSIPLDSG